MTSFDNTHRGKEIVSAATVIFMQVVLTLIMPMFGCFIIFATQYWWLGVLYMTWCCIFDKDAEVTGKGRSEIVRSLPWWVHAKNYYPAKSVKLPWGELDRKRNYLFCYFPHGLISAGACYSLCTNFSEFRHYFPHHKPHVHVMSLFFKIPVVREFTLAIGGLAASKKALENILGQKTGGNISALIVGGAQEAYLCNPGVYKIIYKKRKGFIKIALTQGTPLVPVYVFGENELYSQVEFDGDGLLHKLREIIRRNLGFSPVVPAGGKDTLGLLPRRKPVTVVVGEPIDVQKTENPTQEEIDHLHQLFQEKLVELFDSQKKYYLEDHETAQLEIC